MARVLAALFALYVIWGSTYLAIRFAIETLPPFLMAGVRFVVAGGLLYGWVAMRGGARPTAAQWRASFIIGGLLLVGGNGAVVWAEERVASGVVALLVATVPVWMVLLDWAQGTGGRPTGKLMLGMLLGLVGLGLLVGPDALGGGGDVDPLRAGVVVLGSMSWAAGSIYSRKAAVPRSPLLFTATQMLAGGALLLLLGTVLGEWGDVRLDAVSARSALALAYLIVFGAIVGYSAYVWLLRVSTPARVSTYAYVNPLVAVFLGWALAGEVVSPRIGVAAAVIVAGVAIITTSRTHAPRRPVGAAGADPGEGERDELA
ncbi:MAG TPA: EamA family transporter [Longimicrobiales bacterium]|nr:EamA family transporter [Longimicrobiales bacterium]